MLPVVFTQVAESELAPLLMPPLAFAGVTAAVFLVLGLVTWSFRDVANRHSHKFTEHDDHIPGHGH